MAEFTFKTGNTFPNIETKLTANGTKIDLTNAEHVKMVMKKGATRKELECIIKTPKTEGEVERDWVAEDTETAGLWEVEWVIHYTGGEIQACPSATYDSIEFVPSL